MIRARIVPGVAVLLTLLLGLGVRAASSGDVAKYTGDAFYAQLTSLAASNELGAVHEVTSPDDNLQAVFQYLVK